MIKSPIVVRMFAVLATVAFTAGCATPVAPPPPPAPAPPEAAIVPYRPLPPPQAAYQMDIPRRDVTGMRVTVNSGLQQTEALWHFRSGWNVAALNCQRVEDAPILEGYRFILNHYDREFDQANNALERRFQAQERSNRAALLAREAHMTGVYNYFSSPGARSEFCATARQIATELLTLPPTDFTAFAVSGLARYEQAFERFFMSYEQYERDSAEWDRRYGALYGPSQPGWVAIYGDRVADTSTTMMPMEIGQSGTPVVQPVPSQ